MIMKRSLIAIALLAILATGICYACCTTTAPPVTGISTSSSYSAQQLPDSSTPAELNETLAAFDTYAEKARQR
jgi:hypothetical protein